MAKNYFNVACCEPSLGNHFFDGYSFTNAADVEAYLGLNSGEVTFFDTDKFTTLVPYDINYSGTGSLLDNSIYKDYWGIIRDFKVATSPISRTNVDLYSYNVRNIEDNAFAKFDYSKIVIKNIDSLGIAVNNNPFVNSNNLNIQIGNFKKMSNTAFTDMTDSVVHLGSAIGQKLSGDIYGATNNILFTASTGLTIYCTAAFASSPIVIASLAANPTGVTIITY